MVKKINYAVVKASFEQEGYKLLTTIYINNQQKLEYVCPKGHIRSITWKHWKRGQRCPECKGLIKMDINQLKAIFYKEGFILLESRYINNKTKMRYICPNGHRHSISWSHWKRGNRCPYCSKRIKKTIEEIFVLFAKEGYKLLTKVYKNCESKLEYICPNGHKYVTTWSIWNKGYRCPMCNGHNRYNNDVIKKLLFSEGYTLLSDYEAYHTPMKLMCPDGHIYMVSLANWLSKGYRCQECQAPKRKVSSQEQELKDSLVQSGVEIKVCDRYLIKPYELDIIVPDKKIAIEYCGLYWHSELHGKDEKYHLRKLDYCNDIGYKLVTVFEDEFVHKKDVVLHTLLGILNHQRQIKRISSSDCTISKIKDSTYYRFCDRFSLSEITNSETKFGAFHEDKLVAVMSFSRIENLVSVWKLATLCVHIDFTIPGIELKLLSYFQDSYEWKEIFIDVDRRWPATIDYCKSGFEEAEIIEPCCWYIKRDRRVGRVDQNSDELEKKNLNKIWDCGYLRYTKRKKHHRNTN